MKTIRVYLKFISLFLALLITLQSCSVYHSKLASVDEAIQSVNKVKVITASNDTYRFEKLQKENDQIYGVVKKGTETAIKLYEQGIMKDNISEYVTVLLEDGTIKQIYLKNKTLSTVLTITIPIVGVAVVIFGGGLLYCF